MCVRVCEWIFFHTPTGRTQRAKWITSVFREEFTSAREAFVRRPNYSWALLPNKMSIVQLRVALCGRQLRESVN